MKLAGLHPHQNLVMEVFCILLQLLFFGFVISAEDSFIYSRFASEDMSLSGASYVRPDGILMLTNSSSRIIGHAFHPSALQFKDNSSGSIASFSTNFVFSIASKYPELGGHGLAFVISSSKEMKGSQSNQYLGLPNDTTANSPNHIFAVEFDIVQNIELGDINDNHVGIDIDSLISNASQPAAYFTGNNPRDKQLINLKSGSAVQAWIEYSSSEKLLNVTLTPLDTLRSKWPVISFPVDLSPIFLDLMYVGFSASTGLLTAEHQVLGWSLKVGGKAQDLNPSDLPDLVQSAKVVNSKGFVVGITLASLTLVSLVVLGAFHLVQRLRNDDELLEDWEVEHGAHRFDYSELSAATRGFGERNLIGSGGFGCVYKGVIPSTGLEVAIKRTNHDSRQGIREFIAEITSVGRLRHRNLVKLHGWCRRRDELLLVYDHLPNGSLDKLLLNSKKVLNWEQRYKILNGIAHALLYLHEECDQRVVHWDVKTSNILIDAELNAKLGDFGLARSYEHDRNSQTTHIVGTLGYLAPELTRTGRATTSTDVFAYGTLMLEVACGRRPIEPQRNAQELVLIDWVRDLHSMGDIMKAVDSRLDLYEPEEVDLVLSLGLLCSHPHPDCRPSMRRVVQFLLGDANLPPLPPHVHLENPCYMGESSDTCLDSYLSLYKMTSSKSTTIFASFDMKNGGHIYRSTF